MAKPDLDKQFEIIMLNKDTYASNLNKLFESYGCSTLEAKVPIVSDLLVEKIQDESQEQQLYSTLAFKSKSAQGALEGRLPRTRNRTLRTVSINGHTIIAASAEERERSPVDPAQLDDELDSYMRERAKLRQTKMAEGSDPATSLMTPDPSDEQRVTLHPKNDQSNNQDQLKTQEELDDELERYMAQVSRERTNRRLANERDRQEQFLEDFDQD